MKPNGVFGEGFAPDKALVRSLKVLRVLGVLPYTWPDSLGLASRPEGGRGPAWARAAAASRAPRDGRGQGEGGGAWKPPTRGEEEPLLLVKSKWLTLWSQAFFVALVSVSAISIFYDVQIHINDNETTMRSTTQTAIAINIVAVALVFSNFVVSWSALASLITRLVFLLRRVSVPLKTFSRNGLRCGLVLYLINFSIHFYSLVEAVKVSDQSSTIYFFGYFFVIHILDSAVLALIVMFHSVCSSMSALYKNVLGVGPDSLRETFLAAVGSESECPDGAVHSHSRLRLLRQQLDADKTSFAARLIFDVHELQKAFNDYMAVPVALILLRAMLHLTMSIFYLMSTGTEFAFELSFICLKETTNIILLCCSPELVKEEVDNSDS